MRNRRVTAVLCAAVLLTASTGAAQTGQARSASQEAEAPSVYDDIWSAFTELYKDDSNRFVQEVRFTGRFHHDFAVLDAEEGDHRESNVRRLRVGPRITLFEDWLFHAELDINPQERDPFYVRFTDLYLEWSPSDMLAVTIGKQSAPFTLEGATSSRELLTVDRSSLANNIWFPQEYMPGLTVSGEHGPWLYRGGIYSAGAENRELGVFNGGAFFLGGIGYDFANRLGVRRAQLVGDYVYQQPDEDNTFTRSLEHIASINFSLDEAAWGLRADLSLASGYFGQSDLAAVMVMPFYNITQTLQLVGRYTLVTSDEQNGVRLATYESRIADGRGNRYDEAYAGVNYYFYGHRLKVQSGLHNAAKDDRANDGGAYSGVGWVTGIRVGW
jgi:phosphate-selective porin OprO/OprP